MQKLNEPFSTTDMPKATQRSEKRAWMSPRVEAIKLQTAHNTTQYVTHNDGSLLSSDGVP
jgi:hypothetical protein